MATIQIVLKTEIKSVLFFIAEKIIVDELSIDAYTQKFTIKKYERKYFASYVRPNHSDEDILKLTPHRFTGYTTAWRRFKKLTRTARLEQTKLIIK